MKALKTIKDLFFPSGIKCIFCDDEIKKENRYCVCGNCSPAFNVQYCLNCGKAIANQAIYCDDCMNGKRYAFTQARAPFVYDGKVRGVVKRLKYGGGKFLAPYMAEYMADSFFTAGWKVDVVTFVPMNVKRKKARGYNQAELLAKHVSEIIGVPCNELLKHESDTKNLAGMTRAERAEAIKGAVQPSDDARAILTEGKTILLIDDVMTTSATADECSKALLKLKPEAIYVLTFATSRVKPLLY